MKKTIFAFAGCALALSIYGADDDTVRRAKAEENRSCIQCHSLRIVHSQRLSKGAWTKEVDKMIGWGALVKDRDILINYLSEEYSDSKPVPEPDRSADGVKRSSAVVNPAHSLAQR